MDQVLEESALLGTTMVHQSQTVFNGDDTIVHTLETSAFIFCFKSTQREYIEQKEAAVLLVHNASLNQRELLLGVLPKLGVAGVAVLLSHA